MNPMMNFQTTYGRRSGHPHHPDERHTSMGETATAGAGADQRARSAGILVPRPAEQQQHQHQDRQHEQHEQQQLHRQQQQMNALPMRSKNSTTLLPPLHPVSLPVDSLFLVPGGSENQGPFHPPLPPPHWFTLLSSAPDITGAMRIRADLGGMSMEDSSLAYLNNLGAHFGDEFPYVQPGVTEGQPLILGANTSGPDGGSPVSQAAVEHVSLFDIDPHTLRFDSQPPSDEDLSWTRLLTGHRPRIGQQNDGFPSQEPATIGGSFMGRKRRLSSSAASGKADAFSPSDSSNSWVHLTPETGTPQPPSQPPSQPRTSREPSQEEHSPGAPGPTRNQQVSPPITIGPKQVWNVPQQKKRGRKPGSGGISKDRKKDTGPPKARQVARREGPLREDVRESARITKKFGACRPCHYKKARCPYDPRNPEGVCLTCKRLSPSPCFRYAITEASLYRQQKAPFALWTKRWKSMDMVDITLWESSEVRTIEVSQIFLRAPYVLKVRKFVPQEGDMMHRFWFDGDVQKEMPMPAYAIANMEEAAKSIEQMMKDNVVNYFSSSIDQLSGTGHPGLIWMTYEFAFRHLGPIQDKEEGRLLSDTLKLWIACRLTSYSEAIIGQDTLGMSLSQDPSSPYTDKIPIPPIMVAQLECIVYSRYLQPLSTSVLSQLDRIIGKKKQADWLSVYLTLFLLLHSCALLTQRNAEHAHRLRLKRQFTNMEAIRAHHMGAITLLAHFHFVSGGTKPLRLAEERRLHEYRGNTSFTPAQENFIRDSAASVGMMQHELRRARNSQDMGNPLYWVSQLYDDEWRSDKME